MKRAIILLAVMAAAGLAGAQMFAQLFGGASLPSGPLPAGWTECEYLESTGTQYINTGFAPTLYTTDIEVDCMSLAANNRMWGCSENISSTTMRYREYFTSGGIAYMGAQAPISLGHVISNRAVVAVSSKVWTTDGVAKGIYTGADATFTKTIHLFAETDGATVQNGRSRVYSAKIWSSGVPVRDYLPALDGDGVPCMFDTVTQVPFYNAGTGDFLYKIKEQ